MSNTLRSKNGADRKPRRGLAVAGVLLFATLPLVFALAVRLASGPAQPPELNTERAALGVPSPVEVAAGPPVASASVPFPNVRALIAEVLPPPVERMPMKDLIALVSKSYHHPMGTRSYLPTDPVHWLFLADDPSDADLFGPLLESNNELLAGAACLYVGRIRDQQSFDSLARLTQHPSPGVRRLAAEALGKLGRPEALPFLVKLKSDQDSGVRDIVPSALRDIPGEESARALLDIHLHDEDSLQRDWALQYLRERRDVSVVPELIAALTGTDLGHDTDMLHTTLAELSGHDLIGDYGDPAACAELKAQWARWWAENEAAVKALPKVDFVPETTYCGIGVVLTSAEHQYRDNTVRFRADRVGDGGGVPFMTPDGTPLTVPVIDDCIDNFAQYVIFQGGQEVERGDIPLEAVFNRYMMIPFGPIAHGVTVRQDSFATNVAPGDYELQIEVRSLCTELTYLNYPGNVWGNGACESKGEIFTLISNRVPLTIHAPTTLSPASIEELARIIADPEKKFRRVSLTYATAQGETFDETIPLEYPGTASWLLRFAGPAALPAVLAHLDEKSPTYAQLDFMMARDDLESEVALAKIEIFADERIRSILKRREPKTVSELVATATQAIDSPGWSWSESREALVALDGKLGPEHAEYAGALANELEQRLAKLRDRHAGRPGESLWGAFRTAFFLGRIGDPVAIPVLRKAAEGGEPETENWETNSQSILLRWYAAAALKLIDVQGLPEPERGEEIQRWIRHCFSSPEEHYIARARLVPYLSRLLGEKRPSFFGGLVPTLDDPWMAADAKRWAEAAG